MRQWLSVVCAVVVVTVLSWAQTSAHVASRAGIGLASGRCDLEALSKSKEEVEGLVRQPRLGPSAISNRDRARASAAYVIRSEVCYQELYSAPTEYIDDGGLWESGDGTRGFRIFGTKWGLGSPFTGGLNVPGPGLAGGTVTYSFMPNGVTPGDHGSDTIQALSSLPTYEACFLTEISNAFAAWSSLSNISFVQVVDNGVTHGAVGAVGDIRIGVHTIDGPSGVLAHALFPPPNGASAAGDMHFDRHENWGCERVPGTPDIGIIATHEIGHSIGLDHETTLTAIMNPSYSLISPATPLIDDINAVTSIYGAALAGQLSTAGDFDGDDRTDISVFRPVNGTWYVLRSGSQFTAYTPYQWGVSSDVPVPADYDGDRITDLAVYRPSSGTWFILLSTTDFSNYLSYQWGVSTDIPMPADFDGDGEADVAVFRPGDGTWYIRRSSTNSTTFVSYQWGLDGDIPVTGDFDGDFRSEVAVFRPSALRWYILHSGTNYSSFSSYPWGSSIDTPVAADYDGDRITDVAIYRRSTGIWDVLKSTEGFAFAAALTRQWGTSTDIPVPGDFDGDDKTDFGVFRPASGQWFTLRSSTNLTTFGTNQWGLSTDIPISKRP
jgi:hypothetical protein